LPRPVISASVDACMAAAFSMTIRWYSAALQVPCAIIRLRRYMVSHDASVSWVIMAGRFRLRRFVILSRLGLGGADSRHGFGSVDGMWLQVYFDIAI
jgi:hypothetical protein